MATIRSTIPELRPVVTSLQQRLTTFEEALSTMRSQVSDAKRAVTASRRSVLSEWRSALGLNWERIRTLEDVLETLQNVHEQQETSSLFFTRTNDALCVVHQRVEELLGNLDAIFLSSPLSETEKVGTATAAIRDIREFLEVLKRPL